MKIEGHDKLGPATGKFRMQRGDVVVELTCTALPLAYLRGVIRGLPRPAPAPTGHPMRGADGRPMKDPDSGDTLLETNENTPEFRSRMDEYQDRLAAYHVWLGLRNDPNVTFDVRKADAEDLAPLCDAVLVELEAVGFGSNDLMALSLFVQGLGGRAQDEIDAAKNV